MVPPSPSPTPSLSLSLSLFILFSTSPSIPLPGLIHPSLLFKLSLVFLLGAPDTSPRRGLRAVECIKPHHHTAPHFALHATGVWIEKKKCSELSSMQALLEAFQVCGKISGPGQPPMSGNLFLPEIFTAKNICRLCHLSNPPIRAPLFFFKKSLDLIN